MKGRCVKGGVWLGRGWNEDDIGERKGVMEL